MARCWSYQISNESKSLLLVHRKSTTAARERSQAWQGLYKSSSSFPFLLQHTRSTNRGAPQASLVFLSQGENKRYYQHTNQLDVWDGSFRSHTRGLAGCNPTMYVWSRKSSPHTVSTLTRRKPMCLFVFECRSRRLSFSYVDDDSRVWRPEKTSSREDSPSL